MKSRNLSFYLVPMLLLSILSGVTVDAEKRLTLSESTIRELRWRLLGPAHMSGRITGVAVPKGERHAIYCATATGGIWKTVNNGTVWNPIFEHQETSSIGDIAVAEADPSIVWAGTGEANASSYSSWGNGVYKSTDKGKTWSHVGLSDTHHIGRVIIDPINPDVVYVAALGHLWGPNAERGLYKSVNGGKNWEKILFIDEDVGIVDVAMDPSDNKTIYAASYGRRASRFDDFDSMGIQIVEGSGIYKTTDGGKSWDKLATGLPQGRIGRIGLDISSSCPNIIYAIVERKPYQVKLNPAQLQKINHLLSSSQPEEKDIAAAKELIASVTPPEETPSAVVSGLSRSRQIQLRTLLGQDELDTGGGVFRSDDGGETWRRMNKLNERPGYYSQIRVDPEDPDHIYVLLVRVWESLDGGNSFRQKGWAFSSYLTSNFIHGDFHAMWIDPQDSDHLIVGTDGGLYISYDRGKNWESHPMPIGQFVSVAADMRKPCYLYGGLQDNGVWGGPSATRHVSGVSDSDWFKLLTGDGSYVQVDPSDFNTIFVESQYGAISRVHLKTGDRKRIQFSSLMERMPLRFNYVAPFILSPHDSHTLYLGAQILMKSADRGESWKAISHDLTKRRPDPLTLEGATITTVSESPLKRGVLYVGTDDGNLQLTRDGGQTWTNIADRIQDVPKDERGHTKIWVSRVESSHFQIGTAYVSFDGHRDNDFDLYLYMTQDFGQTWIPIKGSLPEGVPINVIREDIKNENLLFVGTERGIYLSLDRGTRWVRLSQGMPTVPVDDLLVHPRDGDLIAATHGRGLYVMDISPLQQLTEEALEADVFLFKTEPATLFHVDITRNRGASGNRRFAAANPYSELVHLGDRSGLAPPGASIYYYLRKALSSPVTIQIVTQEGKIVRELEGSAGKGIHLVPWDLRESSLPPPPAWRRLGSNDSRFLASSGPQERPGPLVIPGRYKILLKADGRTLEESLLVEEDVLLSK